MDTFTERVLVKEAFIKYAVDCATTKTPITIDECIKATSLKPVSLSGGPKTINNALAFMLCYVRWSHNWIKESPETIRACRAATITLMDLNVYPLDKYCDGTMFGEIKTSYDGMDTIEYWDIPTALTDLNEDQKPEYREGTMLDKIKKWSQKEELNTL